MKAIQVKAEPEIVGFASPKYPDRIVFGLQAFSNTADNFSYTEQQIWNWFKEKGYNDTATSAIMCKIKQVNTQYNPTWRGTSSGVELGIFGWSWTRSTADNTYPIDNDQVMSQKKVNHPNTELTKYLNWCDSKGYAHRNSLNQLEYFFETKSSSLNPTSLNSQDLSQATSIASQSIGNSTSNDSEL